MIHIVYPHKDKISTPNVIGFTLFKILSQKYEVTMHQWDAFYKIKPKEGDILIGHASPAPLTIVNRSIYEKGWKRKILIIPYTEESKLVGYIDNIIDECDCFIAITGKYWFDRVAQSEFKRWQPKMVHQNLAVDKNHFPRIKENFNKPGSRKFVYIGRDYFYKNLDYLEEIFSILPEIEIHSIGKVKRKRRFIQHGFMDFSTNESKEFLKQFDFMITVGNSDPNPTTILESMSWGIIPICTPTSGYDDSKGIINVPLGHAENAAKIVEYLYNCPTEELIEIRHCGDKELIAKYSWEKFVKVVENQILNQQSNDLEPRKVKFNINYKRAVEYFVKALIKNILRIIFNVHK